MFKRREARKWYESAREGIWPSSGFGRTAKYYQHRVMRLPGSSQSIASGLALGVAVSFTPFFGLHLLFALAIAWLVRANLLAAAIGTLVGNPLTFPLILAGTYHTGLFFLGSNDDRSPADVLSNFNFFDDPLGSLHDVLMPFVLGSLPYALVSWVVVYFLVKNFIDSRKKKHAEQVALRATQALHEAKE